MAGGFMAGFGSAFADSFHQDQDQKASERQDMFRMQYQDYISQRDYRQKEDLENKKALNLSRSLVQASGQPPEAVSTAYNLIRNGASSEYVAKFLEENQASVDTRGGNTAQPGEAATASDQPADPRDDLSSAAAGSVDGQMKAAGMATPKEGGIFGKVKQGLHDVFNPEGRTQRNIDANTKKIGDMSGVPQQQVKDTLAGKDAPGEPIDGMPNATIKWTSKQKPIDVSKINTVGDAIAYNEQMKLHGTDAQKLEAKNLVDAFMHQKAAEARMTAQSNGTGFTYARGFIKDANGQTDGSVAIPTDDGQGGYIWKDAHGNTLDESQVIPVDKNMETDIEAVSKENVKPLQDYQQAKADYKVLARTSSEISALAKAHPEAMGKSGDISQFTDSLMRAGVNVAKIVNPKLDPEGNIVPDEGALGEAEKAEHAINSMIGGVKDRNSKNALYATLMDIKATRLAYLWAKDMGQTGRGVSNADFNNFKNVAKGGGNPQALKQSAADFLAEKRKGLLDQEAILKQGGAAGNYFKKKYPSVPLPWDIGQGIDQEVAGDPELSQSIDTVNDNSQPDPNSQMDTTPKDIPEWLSKVKDSTDGSTMTPEVYQNLSPRGKELLKKKYGG